MTTRLLISLAFAVSSSAFLGGCATATPGEPATAQPSSLWEKATAGVKGGSKGLTAMFAPKPAWARAESAEPSNDKIGPNVYVTAAQMSERSGNLEAAKTQYQKALEIDPKNMGALLGYARLEDRQSDFDSALKLYKKALKHHSKEATVHNDLGLCYQHHGMVPEALSSFQKAVKLQPEKKLYRDNLATLLVEQDKTAEALQQLTAAHGEAVGNYNLAFLLVQHQKNDAALEYFRKAAAKDPSLAAAQQWVATLSPPPAQNGPFGTGSALAVNQRPTPLPPVEHDTKAAFLARALPSDPTRPAQTVNANGSVAPSSQQVQPQAETRGVHFPQVHRLDETASDAVPPVPPSPAESASSDSRPSVVAP